MTGTSKPADRAGLLPRVAARTAAAVVALVAGAASFEHIASVAIGAGERSWVAWSLPLAIDGLIVVGVTALIEDRAQGRAPRPVARLAVVTGVAATLAANIASADPSWTARLVALAAPVCFLVSVEVLTRTGRKLSTPVDTNPDHQPTGQPTGQPAATVPAAAVTTPAGTGGKPRNGPSGQARRRPTAAQRVAKAVEQTPDATAAEIAARLNVSERTVQRYRPTTARHNTTTPTTVDDSGGANPATHNNGPADLSSGNGHTLAPVPAGAFTRKEN